MSPSRTQPCPGLWVQSAGSLQQLASPDLAQLQRTAPFPKVSPSLPQGHSLHWVHSEVAVYNLAIPAQPWTHWWANLALCSPPLLGHSPASPSAHGLPPHPSQVSIPINACAPNSTSAATSEKPTQAETVRVTISDPKASEGLRDLAPSWPGNERERKALWRHSALSLSPGGEEPEDATCRVPREARREAPGPVIKETEVDSDGQEVSGLSAARSSQG